MKLETRTLQILKNFASINPGILFKPGNTLNTMTATKTVFANAKIKEDIPSQFAIYDLSKFLGILSLFEQPELQVSEKQMIISSGQQNVRYTFASPDAIAYPTKSITMPQSEIQFKLTVDDIGRVIKAMGVMQLPEIAVVGSDGEMTIQAIDSKNPSSNTYRAVLRDTNLDFKMVFKADNILKIMPGDYDVSISSKGIGHFNGADIEYYIATESNSTFG